MTVVIPLDTNALTVNPPMNITKYSRVTASLALTIGLTAMPRTANAGSCFVWRVTNTPAPCYLVGTLHALRARDYPLPAGYYQALGDSKRLVFEMTMMDPASKFWEKFCRAAAYPQVTIFNAMFTQKRGRLSRQASGSKACWDTHSG
jgi:hypothetical protein